MEKENDENDTVNKPTKQEDVEPTATMTNHRNESPDVDSKDNRRGIPIDKGWGWVCVFACFMMHVIIVGIGKSFGILFIPFAEKFGSSSRETAWITALMAFVALSGGLIVFSVGIGLFGGSFVALIAVMLVDVLGPERLFSAFGICVLFQGVAHLTGPPFAGWLQDITGSWNLSFYMCGSMLLVGTIILLFEPVGRKYMDRKSETPVGRKYMDKKSETPIV